jgi:hypothetical protein
MCPSPRGAHAAREVRKSARPYPPGVPRTSKLWKTAASPARAPWAPTFNGGSFPPVDGIGVQADSKIVVAGTIHTSTHVFAFHFVDTSAMAVARLNPGGSLDTTFGPDGTGGLLAGALAAGTRDLAALDLVFARQPL